MLLWWTAQTQFARAGSHRAHEASERDYWVLTTEEKRKVGEDQNDRSGPKIPITTTWKREGSTRSQKCIIQCMIKVLEPGRVFLDLEHNFNHFECHLMVFLALPHFQLEISKSQNLSLQLSRAVYDYVKKNLHYQHNFPSYLK